MARLPRLTLAGCPHHVIQRGNNRQVIFHDNEDRQAYLDALGDALRQHGVALHSHVLMDNHVHLLLTPADERGLSAVMQSVGRRYAQTHNRRHGRSGGLWEGRFRSTLVQAERYFMACMVYIDLNPVRAGMVDEPARWPWSSHAHYIGLRRDPLVTPHELYWQLGNTPFAREAAYRDLVAAGLSARQNAELTDTAFKGWALGDESFVHRVGAETERRAYPAPRGRPPKR